MIKLLRKTAVVFIVFLVLSGALAVLSGANLYSAEIEVTYLSANEPLSKTYRIAPKHNFNAQFFCGGDMAAYYKRTRLNPLEFLTALNPDFNADITDLYTSVYIQPMNASADFKNGKFVYFPETVGVSLDVNLLCKNIINNFDNKITVGLPLVTHEPRIKSGDMVRSTEKIATFSTMYYDSTGARKHNIALAAKSLDGTIIGAGETLSFNGIVGDRTEAAGFQTAKIIVNGEYVEGTGGGVCQVSTTLYNAWLRAGLAVEKSSSHSLPSSYVPLGFDAMVSRRSDLVLKNDSKSSVYIHATADGATLAFTVFGVKNAQLVTLNSTILSLPTETRGAYVQTYRTITTKDTTKTEPLRKSAYQLPKKQEEPSDEPTTDN